MLALQSCWLVIASHDTHKDWLNHWEESKVSNMFENKLLFQVHVSHFQHSAP